MVNHGTHEPVIQILKGEFILKKTQSIILALVMILIMAATVFAADAESQDVSAKYEQTTTEDEVRSFELTWGDLAFAYFETTEKTWNPDTHTYETVTTGGWDKTEAEITVVNHSNMALNVSMALTPVEGTGVEVALCGKLSAEGYIWLTNPERNNVWLKARILNERGEVLGETGLIRPGEYVQTVKLDSVPGSGSPVIIKIMACEPDTYQSAGAASLNTAIY